MGDFKSQVGDDQLSRNWWAFWHFGGRSRILLGTGRQLHPFKRVDSLKDELVDEDIVTHRDYLESLHDDMTPIPRHYYIARSSLV